MPKFKAAWFGLPTGSDRHIETAGALVFDRDRILLKLLPEYRTYEESFNQQNETAMAVNSEWTPETLFAYHLEGANGYSKDISLPFDVTGPSIDYVAASLVTEIQNRAAFEPDRPL